MTLRTANNPNIAPVILAAIKKVGLGIPLTNVKIQSGQVYIQQRYQMVFDGVFPASNIKAGLQAYTLRGQTHRDGNIIVEWEYYDRWDTQSILMDTVLANIDIDLVRIQSNLESNDSLTLGGLAITVAIPHTELSDYDGDPVTLMGISLIKRVLKLSVNIFPYDV